MALIRISNGPEEVGRAQFSLTQYLHCRCIQHTYISTSGLELESDGAYQNIKWTRGGRKSSIQFDTILTLPLHTAYSMD